jgi:hypothetical protein
MLSGKPDGGRLTIETANAYLDGNYAAMHADVTAGRYVMVAVSDTGVGMPPDVTAKAFDPFFTTKPVGRAPVWASHNFMGSSNNRAATSIFIPSPVKERRSSFIFRNSSVLPIRSPSRKQEI